MPRRTIQFSPGEYYHLYNRGNNRGRVFFERENYLFFLRLMHKHLLPVMDVIAYCLMPTHYHLLVRVKEISEVSETLEILVSRVMMKLSVAYTKAINKRFDRVGSLFQSQFGAKYIDSDRYLLQLSAYLHRNPVEAGLVSTAADWEFSSYRDYLGLREGTLPNPTAVISKFTSPAGYRECVESITHFDLAFKQSEP